MAAYVIAKVTRARAGGERADDLMVLVLPSEPAGDLIPDGLYGTVWLEDALAWGERPGCKPQKSAFLAKVVREMRARMI